MQQTESERRCHQSSAPNITPGRSGRNEIVNRHGNKARGKQTERHKTVTVGPLGAVVQCAGTRTCNIHQEEARRRNLKGRGLRSRKTSRSAAMHSGGIRMPQRGVSYQSSRNTYDVIERLRTKNKRICPVRYKQQGKTNNRDPITKPEQRKQ